MTWKIWAIKRKLNLPKRGRLCSRYIWYTVHCTHLPSGSWMTRLKWYFFVGRGEMLVDPGDLVLIWGCITTLCQYANYKSRHQNPYDFMNQSWYPKHPLFNGCFTWMIRKSLFKRWLFHHFHPSKNGCLGFQDIMNTTLISLVFIYFFC